MKTKLKRILLTLCVVLLGVPAFAQSTNTLKAVLLDSASGEPVSFATVSLTVKGASKPAKYTLSSEQGVVKIDGVKNGTYTIKAELLGYVAYEKEVKVAGPLDLGELGMDPDKEVLDAAQVSAVGNPIVIKKDTVEYNATSFKTTENDALEDLLKKLPGVEVSEDGSITYNGESIKKITIEGRTFFLDDPQLASKNIPAKLVNKLKVIKKKSEQAEFTGIDDGEEETVIDLSVKKGMMNGTFGNVMAGAGNDIPSSSVAASDLRYQGAAFVGKFTEKTQIGFIFNGNNTNNRGFNDLSGSMMGSMRGGGGPMGRGQGGWGGSNGITTSYMGGANASSLFFKDKMELTGNYLYNYTDKEVEEATDKVTYLDDHNLLSSSSGSSSTISGGHRFGMRLEHKFSENTSILFEPQINFGTGNFGSNSKTSTDYDYLNGSPIVKANSSESINTGDNRNLSTSGFFLLRQRLGIPGRTLTAMSRYSYSNNELSGANFSNTEYFDEGISQKIDQVYDSNSQNTSVFARMTYTEPLGNSFYVEANYSFNWNKNSSDKETRDRVTNQVDYTYSNSIINSSNSQEFGVNALYQNSKMRAQVGFAAIPTNTYNSTTSWNAVTGKYAPQEYESHVWNFSPRVMLWGDLNENTNVRAFYFGRSAQPSVNKLMPVPDNTNPINLSFGNPSLQPYFSHSINTEYRFSNRKTFFSYTVRADGGFVQNPIVSATWYGTGGKAFNMPFNGPTSMNANINFFLNAPIAKSNFSISSMGRLGVSKSASYVGTDIDMSTYDKDGYYAFMEEFIGNFNDEAYFNKHIAVNKLSSLSGFERLRVTYRNDNLELSTSARSRFNKSWYSISTMDDTSLTLSNQLNFAANWTWDQPGLTIKSDLDYNWYVGYKTPQDDQVVLNAEIQKFLFKKKVTLALKGYDIFGQAKNLTVMDESNYHSEVVNNTLGRYIILSLTYRFGTFDASKMRGHGGPGGPGGPPRR